MRFDTRTSSTRAGVAINKQIQRSTSVDDLLAEELTRCCDCGRTPLIGEHVHLYESADLVCELCRMLRTEEPVMSTKVTPRLGPGYHSDPAFVVRVSRR